MNAHAYSHITPKMFIHLYPSPVSDATTDTHPALSPLISHNPLFFHLHVFYELGEQWCGPDGSFSGHLKGCRKFSFYLKRVKAHTSQ